MRYALVVDGVVSKETLRPNWFTDSGPITDEELIIEGIYPLEDNIPEYNPVTHSLKRNNVELWEVLADKVKVTYQVIESSPEEIKAKFSSAIQRCIDATASTRLYDSGTTISTYVNSTNPVWAAEAAAFVEWRDSVWEYAFTELEKVLNGQRPIPTIEGFIGELPDLVWPSSAE